MRVMVLLLALASAFALAADNAVVAPRTTVSRKPQATTLGAESITIPQMLSYQGRLTDTLGVPVPDGNYPMMFLLYTVPSGGSSFWSENQSVTVKDGLFSALLGSATPIGSLPDAGVIYLAMTVSGGPELTPRIRIVSSAFAYLSGRAASADLLQGKDTTALDSRYVNEGQASSVTSNMIVDGTIAAADLGQMGAASGQVMKWTGSAWAPRNDSVGGGGGGGTVTSVSQAAGAKCTPNPITTTGTVGLDTTYSDGRYIKNQFASNQTANWRIVGLGRCTTATALDAALHGINTSATGCGVRGDGTSFPGVYGTNTSSSYAAIEGYNSATSPGGWGVEGHGSAAIGVLGQSASNFGVRAASTSNYGVFGSSTDSAGVCGFSTNRFGVYGASANSDAVCGSATASNRAGVYGQSTNGDGVVGYSDTTTTRGYGVFARARNNAVYGKSDYFKGVYGEAIDDDGVYGYAHGTTLTGYAGVHGNAASDSTYGVKGEATGYPGVYGTNSSQIYAAVEGRNNATGTGSAGVAGFGDTSTGAAYGVYGRARSDGVYGVSTYWRGVEGQADEDDGVLGYYSGTSSLYAGVYGARNNDGYGVYYSGGLSGSGNKNCVMRTSRGPTALYCQESPENWFEDFGSGTLANGHAHVNLDALFLETVTVDQNHGIKVFLQQTSGDPVNLVVQKGTTGFDVNGPAGSNITFDYRVVAKRKGFEDTRLPVVSIGYNDPYLYPTPNDPQIPAPIRAKRLEAARLAAMNNGTGPQPHPSNPTTIQKVDPTGMKPQNGPNGR